MASRPAATVEHPGAGSTAASRAPWIGLAVALALITITVLVPRVFHVQVNSHDTPSARDVPPLHSLWEPKLGVGTLPAILLALLAARYAVSLAQRLSWRALLLMSYAVGLAWLISLAYVDGSAGISRVLGNPYEYLRTARGISDVPAMLHEFISRIPYAAPDNWVTHVTGHPPGALLFFVGLVRIGLGGDWAAGMVVTLIAASTPLAVLVTLRTLGAETTARKAAPFLALGPAAVWSAVSADAMFAAVAAWGLATLALGATHESRAAATAWSVLAGLLLGYCMLLSYGLPLLGLLAIAVLIAARSWTPLPIAAVSALVVVLGFAVGGFALWEALPVLRERYSEGIAGIRPAAYWLWGNLAALCLSAGPLLGAAIGRLVVGGRDRIVLLLSGAAVLCILAAEASGMSKAEVERIWLPFVPWLLVATALLPERWRRWGLGLQLVTALLLQHLLYTSW